MIQTKNANSPAPGARLTLEYEPLPPCPTPTPFRVSTITAMLMLPREVDFAAFFYLVPVVPRTVTEGIVEMKYYLKHKRNEIVKCIKTATGVHHELVPTHFQNQLTIVLQIPTVYTENSSSSCFSVPGRGRRAKKRPAADVLQPATHCVNGFVFENGKVKFSGLKSEDEVARVGAALTLYLDTARIALQQKVSEDMLRSTVTMYQTSALAETETAAAAAPDEQEQITLRMAAPTTTRGGVRTRSRAIKDAAIRAEHTNPDASDTESPVVKLHCTSHFLQSVRKMFPYFVYQRSAAPGDREEPCKAVMYNTDFSAGFKISLRNLSAVLKADPSITQVKYIPEVYPAVCIKYMWNRAAARTRSLSTCIGPCRCTARCNGRGSGDGDGNCKIVTASIFYTGSVIITGANAMDQVRGVYTEVASLLKRHYSTIVHRTPLVAKAKP